MPLGDKYNAKIRTDMDSLRGIQFWCGIKMKIKVKRKDCQLKVRIRLPLGVSVNEQELSTFTRTVLRGFLKPEIIKRNSVVFTGPVGISLKDRLAQPISKYDFFFIMEQIVDATQKLRKYGMLWDKVLWNVDDTFINESTKEMQFIYLPLSEPSSPPFSVSPRLLHPDTFRQAHSSVPGIPSQILHARP